MSKRLVLMNGLPGAGKSSQAGGGRTVVRLDSIRREWGHVCWWPLEPMVQAVGQTMAGALLRDEDQVVVDDVFPSRASVEPWVQMARRFQADLEMEVVTTAPWLCLQRRLGLGDGEPWEEAIGRMARELARDWAEIRGMLDAVTFKGVSETMWLQALLDWTQSREEGRSMVADWREPGCAGDSWKRC